ncbi:MAG: transketolase C-terminal domain-containing protein [Anaerolineae bacterium]
MRELIDGATAVVRGALAAGCDFFAGYPITPATPILLRMMREMPKAGGIAVQGEDEISSIGMCIGAAAAGRRALTATSGPGLSLYSENIGLALMAELPLVIVDVQRLGPGTGGATTIGQGDVQFARWGTGGGYPLIVLAPSSVEECVTLTFEAFSLAQRFRCPVIVLTDKELNLTRVTVSASSLIPPGMDRSAGPVEALAPLGSGGVVRFTGSTHDDDRMITKDPAAVSALNRRLIDKIEAHRHELERLRLDLQEAASTLLVSFGTTSGAMMEAIGLARGAGKRVSGAVVQSLWPVPERALMSAAEGVSRVVVGELNPGLYAREIRCLFPDKEIVSLTRIDGQLIPPDMYLEQVL